MMRRCAGLNADEAWRQLLEECQDVTSLQLAPDDHFAYRVNTVDLKHRLRDVETDRRDPGGDHSMALTCRWRSRPQHQFRKSASSSDSYSGSPALRRLLARCSRS